MFPNGNVMLSDELKRGDKNTRRLPRELGSTATRHFENIFGWKRFRTREPYRLQRHTAAIGAMS